MLSFLASTQTAGKQDPRQSLARQSQIFKTPLTSCVICSERGCSITATKALKPAESGRIPQKEASVAGS